MNRLFFLLVMVGWWTNLSAQHTFRNLEDIWVYAEAHSFSLVNVKSSEEIAKKNIMQAVGGLWPTVSVSGAFSDNVQIQPTLIPGELFGGEPGTFKEEQFGKRYVYNASINAQLDIINTKKWFDIKHARSSYEQQSRALAVVKSDLYGQLAEAYYMYLFFGEAAVLSTENLKISKETYEYIEVKFNEGLVSEVVFNTAKINLKKADISLTSATLNKVIALNNLKLLLDLKSEDSVLVEGKFESDISHFPQVDFDFNYSPEVTLSYSELQLARVNKLIAKSLYVPSLSAIYFVGKQKSGDQFFNLENTNDMPQQYWGLRLTIPILSGNTRVFQNSKTHIEYNTKQLEYESIQRQSAINDENLVTEYKSAYKSYVESAAIFQLYKQNDWHANQKLNEGIISVEERLRVYQDMIVYQNEYLKAMSDYFTKNYHILIRQKSF